MKKKQKSLYIGDSPIKYVMRFYIPLMIALSDANAENWFCSSYINTKVKKNNESWMIYQNHNPFVIRFPFPFFSSTLLTKTTLQKKIQWLIEHGYYISVFLDFYYLKGSIYYLKKHYFHSVLLYGYDFSESKKIFLSGYCFGTKIKAVEMSYNDLADAFFACRKNKTWIYKKRKVKKKKFDMRFFYLGIKNYLFSSCSFAYQFKSRSFSIPFLEIYGIKAHSQLKSDLMNSPVSNCERITIRICSYCELTKAMIKRLKYIEDNKMLIETSDIKELFLQLLFKYEHMLNLIIKFRITGNYGLINKIITLEEDAYKQEEIAYERLYSLLKEQWGYK